MHKSMLHKKIKENHGEESRNGKWKLGLRLALKVPAECLVYC